MFQFQSGAIKGADAKRLSGELLSFNSSLVRLKVGRDYFAYKPLEVSIPIWCD